ncbi:hypothetical protein CL622_01055 [archaeon]|nr:hypothetical protein [archaeon]
MDLDQALHNRHSCKRYTTKRVGWKKLHAILTAGRLAPSAGNLQPWRFIVITNQKTKSEIAGCCLKQYWLTEAPVLIFVCADSANIKRHFGVRGELYTIQSCSAAIENMLLKATDLGLGSCWVGAFDETSVKRVLNIPDEIRPQAVLSIGYPDEKPEPKQRFPVELVTYYEEYGNTKNDKSFFPLEKHPPKIKEETKRSLSGLFKRKRKS